MRLSAVEVSGFRSLAGSPLTGLETVNALVGRNNSGKTAVLESLLLLSTLAKDQELSPLQAVLPWGRPTDEVVADSVTDGAERASINLCLHFKPSIQDVDSFSAQRASFPVDKATAMPWLYEFTLKTGERNWPGDQLIPMSVVWLADDERYEIVDYPPDRPPNNANYRQVALPQLENALAAGQPRGLVYSATVEALAISCSRHCAEVQLRHSRP